MMLLMIGGGDMTMMYDGGDDVVDEAWW